jgi:ankyrin repeat protein
MSASPRKPSSEEMDKFCDAAGYKNDVAVVADFLSRYGADIIDEKDKYGRTALMYAALWGRKNTATLLLDGGADIHKKDENGWTGAMWAKDHPEIAALIRQQVETRQRRLAEEEGQKEQAAQAAQDLTDARLEKLKTARPPKSALKKNRPPAP